MLEHRNPKNAMQQAPHIILLEQVAGSLDKTLRIPCIMSVVIGRRILGGLEITCDGCLLANTLHNLKQAGRQLTLEVVMLSNSHMDAANSS